LIAKQWEEYSPTKVIGVKSKAVIGKHFVPMA
jgi:hypothetical protein